MDQEFPKNLCIPLIIFSKPVLKSGIFKSGSVGGKRGIFAKSLASIPGTPNRKSLDAINNAYFENNKI